MTAKRGLMLLFALIFTSLLACTVWASLHQPVLEWRGLVRPPDHYWTIATLMDAYFGFITFFVWLAFKEKSWAARIGWLIAILAAGNMAMSAYLLIQLARLRPDEPVRNIFRTAAG